MPGRKMAALMQPNTGISDTSGTVFYVALAKGPVLPFFIILEWNSFYAGVAERILRKEAEIKLRIVNDANDLTRALVSFVNFTNRLNK